MNKKIKICLVRYLALIVLNVIPIQIFANEPIVAATGMVEGGIIWDLNYYTAFVDFMRIFPQTPEDQADSVRVSFSRLLTHEDYSYLQKWSIMVDSLEIRTVNEKSKVFIDGNYKRDSVIMHKEYQIIGPLTLYCSDYQNLNGTPTGRPNETLYKGHSAMKITTEFFDALNSYNEWAVKETEKDYIDPFGTGNIYLIGSDSTYVLKIDSNKKIVINVNSNNMQISYCENNRTIKSYSFIENKSHIVKQYTSEKGSYIKVYPNKGEDLPYIEFKDSVITLFDNNKMIFNVNTSNLHKAVNLAKARGILKDDNKYESTLWDWF